jgi:hypothetical protein
VRHRPSIENFIYRHVNTISKHSNLIFTYDVNAAMKGGILYRICISMYVSIYQKVLYNLCLGRLCFGEYRSNR